MSPGAARRALPPPPGPPNLPVPDDPLTLRTASLSPRRLVLFLAVLGAASTVATLVDGGEGAETRAATAAAALSGDDDRGSWGGRPRRDQGDEATHRSWLEDVARPSPPWLDPTTIHGPSPEPLWEGKAIALGSSQKAAEDPGGPEGTPHAPPTQVQQSSTNGRLGPTSFPRYGSSGPLQTVPEDPGGPEATSLTSPTQVQHSSTIGGQIPSAIPLMATGLGASRPLQNVPEDPGGPDSPLTPATQVQPYSTVEKHSPSTHPCRISSPGHPSGFQASNSGRSSRSVGVDPSASHTSTSTSLNGLGSPSVATQPGKETENPRSESSASTSPATSPSPSTSLAAPDHAALGANSTSDGGDDMAEVIVKKHHTLTMGYLTALKGERKDRQGLAISGAISLALHEINTDPDILPGVHLSLRWEDTQGETVHSTRALTQMICSGVSAFFGPEGSCNVEAIISKANNKPMISYKCSDYKASNISTFARTEPPLTQVTKSILALLRYYNWKKFTVLYEEAWESVGASLQTEAKKENMTVNHYRLVPDHNTCCTKKLPCCTSDNWYRVIHETKNRTRIYAFLGHPTSLIDMMGTMQAHQLFDNGEYVVITVDTMTYTPKEAMKFLWKPEVYQKFNSCHEQKEFAKRAHSLLVIMASPPSQNYDSFTENVRIYNSRPPFDFVTPKIFIGSNFHKHVSIYAAYLYDSVKLYARALDTILREKGHSAQRYLPPENITEIAADGELIIKTIISNRSYQSITGAIITLDDKGDSEGNFSVLAVRKHDEVLIHDNFSCPYQLLPVGLFQKGKKTLDYRLINSTTQIQWAGTSKPEDEPRCGFDNEFCQRPDDTSGWREISSAMATVLALLLFCAMVCTLYVYRKWKIEQEIEGLLWRIHPSQLNGYFQGGNEIVSSPSKLSLVSGVSYESRCGMQLFAKTGFYKGSVVRVKELRFGFGKEDRGGGGSNSGIGLPSERERSGTGTPHISRETMKEMRILRELRHDNINSFVGACVMESTGQVLIVTDYCAKGSLYDIVENEDIKLDEMFIASLVHDLIKGMLYLHNSPLGCHGNLKSSNCVVTSRWILQLTDFGLHELRQGAESDSIGEHQYYRSLLWKAPELLRGCGNVRGNRSGVARGTQKGDVYAFALILYELFGRKCPFDMIKYEPKEIVNFVRHGVVGTPEWANPKRSKVKPGKESLQLNMELSNEEELDEKKLEWIKEGKKMIDEEVAESGEEDPDGEYGEIEPFRPDLDYLARNENVPQYILSCIQDCWAEDPDARPDFHAVRSRLKKMREGMHRNIMDQMMDMMEKYANNLEELVSQRTKLLDEEKQKTEDLLHRMLPQPVAMRLTKGLGVEPESFDSVTIYFSDIVGFTAMSAESSPLEVVNFLNDLYTLFDRIIRGYDVYKVETIGDAYMVVSGLPIRNGDAHAGEIASMSLDLLEAVGNHRIAHRPTEKLKLRIGIHTGPVVAGVVGLTMPRYCLFGDTVNTASRMESSGEPLRIHISDSCRRALENHGGYIVEERGLVFVKGKGDVKTHWLVGANPEKAILRREDPDLSNLAPLFSRPANCPVGRRSPKMSSGAGNCSRRQSGISRWAESPDTVPSSSPMRRKKTGPTFEEEDEDEDAQMSDASRRRGGSLGIDAAQLALKRGSRDLLAERRGSGGLLAALGRSVRPQSGRVNRDSINLSSIFRGSGNLAEERRGSVMEDQRGSVSQLDPPFSSKSIPSSKVNIRKDISDGGTTSSVGALSRCRKRSGSAMNILSDPGNSIDRLEDGELAHRRSFHELLLPKAVERLQHERLPTPVRFEAFNPLKTKDVVRSKLNLQKEGIHSSQNTPCEENSRLLQTDHNSPFSSHESIVTASHCNTPASNSSLDHVPSPISHDNASISAVDDLDNVRDSLILASKKDDDSEATVQFDMSLDRDGSHVVGKPNGGIHDLKGFSGDTMEGDELCSKGVKAPLLAPPSPQSSSVSSAGGRKKWKSLEEMGQVGRSAVSNHGKHGKGNLRSWLLGFFGGSNGMRGSTGGRGDDGKSKEGLGSHSDRESMV